MNDKDSHPKELYRYVDGYSYNAEPKLLVYYIVRETPKGYHISQNQKDSSIYDLRYSYKKDKWVPKKAKRPFVYTNKEQALYSYFRRKIVHEKILTAQVFRIKQKISYIRKYLDKATDVNGKYKENRGIFLSSEDMDII